VVKIKKNTWKVKLLSYTDLLYEREALKIEILADRPRIPAFIRNSYQLWGLSQWSKSTPHGAFYGTGLPWDVLGRQLARKSCMTHWRDAKETGKTQQLITPMATVLKHTRDIALNMQHALGTETPYEALVNFQTSGFINPLTSHNMGEIRNFVRQGQTNDPIGDHPPVSRATQDYIIDQMLHLAGLDTDHKVEILYDTAHPACLGYGGVEKGVKLGVTHDPHMSPLKSLITNWHEIGHAVYRQSIPYGNFVAGRAMDEAMAFLFEYWIGFTDDFLQFLLDHGLKEAGYDLAMLKEHATEIVRDTKRIETNPIRHIIDIDLCESLERALINEEIEAEDCEVEWAKLIEPYADILPEDYPYYYDVHMMSGIYGDRASYNPGMLAAMQIGQEKQVTLGNFKDVVFEIAQSRHEYFGQAVEGITGIPFKADAFMRWVDDRYNHWGQSSRPKPHRAGPQGNTPARP
jgi:Zn-dependent M32 family carboxypeptidase